MVMGIEDPERESGELCGCVRGQGGGRIQDPRRPRLRYRFHYIPGGKYGAYDVCEVRSILEGAFFYYY
jgi:hypothetical protein